ncbi:serine/threonine-protein kinase RsbT [Duganella sacchari]|uniref:Serine/threonine-protein kinase RsbT n=1 Tax=Duganella sacchari TaxID=551987 RepID=A0A1M7R742_9BURK|nr:ATP-binding protein [Duganella sacchari]SHN41971.1 serine/threonine-protein kinase RsbT [Duganella sacchari]
MNTAHAPDAVRFDSRLLRGGGQQVQNSATLPLHTDEHVVGVRKVVREMALALKLSLVEQTKLVTAASELARNTIKYGGGGMVLAQTVGGGAALGIRLVFADDGPGIADVALALRDGYTSGGGLGLGLGGAKRLVDEFDIDTRSGEGTAVAILKWKK